MAPSKTPKINPLWGILWVLHIKTVGSSGYFRSIGSSLLDLGRIHFMASFAATFYRSRLPVLTVKFCKLLLGLARSGQDPTVGMSCGHHIGSNEPLRDLC